MASSEESGSEFEVNKILKQRKRKGLIEYLVQWKDDQDESWEPVKNLGHCKDVIDKFNKDSAKKSRSRSSSRSRSRSRGRSSSRGRKSPARKRQSPKKEAKTETTTVRSRRSVPGGTVEKTETVTKTVQERRPDDSTRRSVVTEKIETVRVQNRSDSAPHSRKGWTYPEYLRFTQSDYPLMVIFTCITIIILSFVIEKHVDFGAIWSYIVGFFTATTVFVKRIFTNPNSTAS